MDQEANGSEKARLLAGMGFALAYVMLMAVFVIGFKSQVTAAPKKFIPYVAPDKSFACKMPEGWKRVETVAAGTAASVRAEQGYAKISIFSDLAGSLMADIARAGDAQMENLTGMMPGNAPPVTGPRPPVEKLHLQYVDIMERKWDEFEDSEMKPIQVPLGECRVSEWSGKKANSPGSTKMRGLRATILSGERRIVVLTYCTDKEYKVLVNSFSQIIRSMKPGE
jgi:hypothetical protein